MIKKYSRAHIFKLTSMNSGEMVGAIIIRSINRWIVRYCYITNISISPIPFFLLTSSSECDQFWSIKSNLSEYLMVTTATPHWPWLPTFTVGSETPHCYLMWSPRLDHHHFFTPSSPFQRVFIPNGRTINKRRLRHSKFSVRQFGFEDAVGSTKLSLERAENSEAVVWSFRKCCRLKRWKLSKSPA